jgi:hypothetical protein
MANLTSEECFDPSFAEEPAHYFYLVLELQNDRAQAIWYHATNQVVTGYAIYPYNGRLSDLMTSFPKLTDNYKEVLLTIKSSNYLLYPNILGNSISEETFRLTNDLKPNHDLKYFQLVNLKAQVVYPIYEVLDRESHTLLQHFRMIPHIAPAIELEVNHLKTEGLADAVWLYTYHETLDLRVYEAGKLKIANSFFQSGKEDIAYFLLYTAEILKLNPESTPLFLGGELKENDESWQLLQDYWKNLIHLNSIQNATVSSAIPTEKFYNLAHLSSSLLCAS